MERVLVKSAVELRDEMVLAKGKVFDGEALTQKAPRRWEPKDGKGTRPKKKGKHRAQKRFNKVSGNKTPQDVSGSDNPEQIHPDNNGSHLLRNKGEGQS
jgi:hypothetical protein